MFDEEIYLLLEWHLYSEVNFTIIVPNWDHFEALSQSNAVSFLLDWFWDRRLAVFTTPHQNTAERE